MGGELTATTRTGHPAVGGFSSTHASSDPIKQSQIFLIHPDGTGRKQVTHFGKQTTVTSSSFSPDGKSIVFGKGPWSGNIDVYTCGSMEAMSSE